MKVTLLFPTYSKLSDFLLMAGNKLMELDIKRKSLTAEFNNDEVKIAEQNFQARSTGFENREDRGLAINH